MSKSSRFKHATLVGLWFFALAVLAMIQAQIPLPPTGTLVISCQFEKAPYQKGKIFVDGLEVGRCPGATVKALVGTRSVRVGEALGNNRYLVYENEQVEVRKDSTLNITATLTSSTGERSPSLAFALGVKPISRIQPPDDFKIAAFSPDTSVLVIGAETNSVRLYNVADGKNLRRLGEPGEYWVSFVTALSFSADGKTLASNGWLYDKFIGEINIWDVASGRLTRTITGVKEVSALALSPDGQFLAAGVAPNTIKLWSVKDGKLLWNISQKGVADGEVSPLFFSPDGRMLFSGQRGADKIHVYDSLTAKHRFTVSGKFVTLARDGQLITYSFNNSGATRNIWSALKGELVESKQVKYSPSTIGGISDRIVVIGSEVWDARREQLMLRLPGNYAIALSADGRRVLMHTGGEGHTIWSLPAMPGD